MFDPLGFGLEHFVQREDLLDDLPGGQVSLYAADAAGAELTLNGAPHLRADAGRPTVGVGDHDGFRVRPVAPGQQELARAVAAILPPRNVRAGKLHGFIETLPVQFRQVGHPRGIGDELAVDPVAHLVRAERRPVPARHEGVETFTGQAEKLDGCGNGGVGRHKICTYPASPGLTGRCTGINRGSDVDGSNHNWSFGDVQ